MIERVLVRPGDYHDSVRLMQASAALRREPGVADAFVAMATPLNLDLLAGMRFSSAELANAGPDDLVIAIRARDAAGVSAALAAADEALAPAAPDGDGSMAAPPPRMLGEVAAADVALVSVPGEHAFVEAMDALRAGMHVMVFSDNVPLEQEVALKSEGARLGRIVMGPDCGTSLLAGIGLGFANAVGRGPVGIVGAAGSGIQQLCCLVDEGGGGVSHAIGTGGRDLSAEVGGASTLAGLAALADDTATEVIILVSKPPAPQVAAALRSAAASLSTPVVPCFIGEPGVTMAGAAAAALARLGRPDPHWDAQPVASPAHRPGFLYGLFSGGSLRHEAAAIATASLGPVAGDEDAPGHRLVDFGGDRYTRGRAHPMIDQTLRLDRLERLAAHQEVGVVLLDVVLGFGAHPDPAAELAPLVAAAVDAGAAVVVSLCGARGDPQDRTRQLALLGDAGASVFLSNAAAAEHAVALTMEAGSE